MPGGKQLKEARKGNGSPRKGNQWPRKGNGPPPPLTGTEALFIVGNTFNCNASPYCFNCRVSRGAPKKRPKYRTPARVKQRNAEGSDFPCSAALEQLGGMAKGSVSCLTRSLVDLERGKKTPTPKISALPRERPVLLRSQFCPYQGPKTALPQTFLW